MQELSVLIGTPAYGGMVATGYVNSLLRTSYALREHGIRHETAVIPGGAIVTHARNVIANRFYFSPHKHTHLLFLDADMIFRPQDILALLQAEKDLVGLPYAYKTIAWDRVADAVRRGVTDPRELEKVGSFVQISRLPETSSRLDPGAVWEVHHIDCGLMLISRVVFDRFAAAFPDRIFRAEPNEVPDIGNEWGHEFFRTSTIAKTKQAHCEDWTFCDDWRGLGGKVHLVPAAVTGHQNGIIVHWCDLGAMGRNGVPVQEVIEK
jgi:hypothetical protein